MTAEDPKYIRDPNLGDVVIQGGYDDAVGSFNGIDLRDYRGSQFTVLLNQYGSPCKKPHEGSIFWIITLPLRREWCPWWIPPVLYFCGIFSGWVIFGGGAS